MLLSSLFSSFPPFSQLFLVPVSIPNPALERGSLSPVHRISFVYEDRCTYILYIPVQNILFRVWDKD